MATLKFGSVEISIRQPWFLFMSEKKENVLQGGFPKVELSQAQY